MKIADCKIQFNKSNQYLNPQIQNICFESGIRWATVGKNIFLPKAPFLYIGEDNLLTFEDHGDIDVMQNTSEGQESFNSDDRPEISPIEFILKHTKPTEPDKLDDEPKKPEIAERNNIGKIPLSYIFDFPIAMLEFCRVCMNGAKKYKRDNWKKGRPYRDTIDSLMRHVEAFQNGEGYYDEILPSGETVTFHHLANAMWNCAALLEWSLSNRTDLDDRYKK